MALFFFFFNDTATTEIYTLSLHDALPISRRYRGRLQRRKNPGLERPSVLAGDLHCQGLGHRPGLLVQYDGQDQDRKSTRLNSSHANISYAVFCLKTTTHAIDRRAVANSST